MSRVRSGNTKPELAVRRIAHRLGYRYRLHARDLPGKPDMVFRSRRKVIFVHGCFWHRHEGCKNARLPKSRLDFWLPKLDMNQERDRRNVSRLTSEGWNALIVWECETRDESSLGARLISFLGE